MPKFKKASVLVYSLIILSVMLMIAVAFSATSIVNKRNSMVTSKSSQSFQVADSAVSMMLKKIEDAASGSQIGSLGSCSGGMITMGSSDGLRNDSTAEIIFKDSSDNILSCTDDVSDVDHIKSTGKFADTARAVEVAVAAGEFIDWDNPTEIKGGSLYGGDKTVSSTIYKVCFLSAVGITNNGMCTVSLDSAAKQWKLDYYELLASNCSMLCYKLK